jgi:hypothetical protein
LQFITFKIEKLKKDRLENTRWARTIFDKIKRTDLSMSLWDYIEGGAIKRILERVNLVAVMQHWCKIQSIKAYICLIQHKKGSFIGERKQAKPNYYQV